MKQGLVGANWHCVAAVEQREAAFDYAVVVKPEVAACQKKPVAHIATTA